MKAIAACQSYEQGTRRWMVKDQQPQFCCVDCNHSCLISDFRNPIDGRQSTRPKCESHSSCRYPSKYKATNPNSERPLVISVNHRFGSLSAPSGPCGQLGLASDQVVTHGFARLQPKGEEGNPEKHLAKAHAEVDRFKIGDVRSSASMPVQVVIRTQVSSSLTQHKLNIHIGAVKMFPTISVVHMAHIDRANVRTWCW